MLVFAWFLAPFVVDLLLELLLAVVLPVRVDDEDEMRGNDDCYEDESHDSLVNVVVYHLVAFLHRTDFHIFELVLLLHILARLGHHVVFLIDLIDLPVGEEDVRDLERDVRVEEVLSMLCAIAEDHIEEERHAHQCHHHSDRVEVLELVKNGEAHERTDDHHAHVNRDAEAAVLNLHFIF